MDRGRLSADHWRTKGECALLVHNTSNLRRQNQQYFANRSLPGSHGNNLLSVRGVPLKTGHDQYLPMLPEAESQRNVGHIGMEATQKSSPPGKKSDYESTIFCSHCRAVQKKSLMGYLQVESWLSILWKQTCSQSCAWMSALRSCLT